jgi:hypothetical protein
LPILTTFSEKGRRSQQYDKNERSDLELFEGNKEFNPEQSIE